MLNCFKKFLYDTGVDVIDALALEHYAFAHISESNEPYFDARRVEVQCTFSGVSVFLFESSVLRVRTHKLANETRFPLSPIMEPGF